MEDIGLYALVIGFLIVGFTLNWWAALGVLLMVWAYVLSEIPI